MKKPSTFSDPQGAHCQRPSKSMTPITSIAGLKEKVKAWAIAGMETGQRKKELTEIFGEPDTATKKVLELISEFEASLRERLKGYRKEVGAWRKSGFGDIPNSGLYARELLRVLGEGGE